MPYKTNLKSAPTSGAPKQAECGNEGFARSSEAVPRGAMRANAVHKVRKLMQGRNAVELCIPLQKLQTPQGHEYARTPYYHSIRAECQKLERVVFWQWSDKKQKENQRAFFVSWSEAERYKKQDLFPYIFPTNFYINDFSQGLMFQISSCLLLLNLKNEIHQVGI